MGKTERFYYFFILIISALFVLDLFISSSLPATMDGLIHVATIAQFSDALLDFNFPVVWLNNFATYGLPVGLFSHQVPIYLGSIINLIVKDSILSTNLVTFLGIALANVFFYKFLRIYFTNSASLLATLLFALAPYRILNVYIRGAIPETFSLFFLPLILICLERIFVQKSKSALIILVISITGLMLTHPMMIIIYSFFIGPYFIFLLVTRNKMKENNIFNKYLAPSFIFILSFIISLGIAGYYLIPLWVEKKYFYFGQSESLFNQSFLTISNFINSKWYYFYSTDIFTRGHVIQAGPIESLVVVFGVLLLGWKLITKKNDKSSLLFLTVISGLLIAFFMVKISLFAYVLLTPLQNIQFPWRMLSVFVIIPPLVFAICYDRFRAKWIFYLVILLVVLIRIPELYGKNYALYPETFFHTTRENLHSVNMNTVWTGKTEDYPVRKEQASIVEGKGNIKIVSKKNDKRDYLVNADNSLQILERTFYFPGWNAYIDGKKVPIQFQNPSYRGVITFGVPSGQHRVQVVFEDTSVRLIAKIVSISSLIFFVIFILFRKRILLKVYEFI